MDIRSSYNNTIKQTIHRISLRIVYNMLNMSTEFGKRNLKYFILLWTSWRCDVVNFIPNIHNQHLFSFLFFFFVNKLQNHLGLQIAKR